MLRDIKAICSELKFIACTFSYSCPSCVGSENENAILEHILNNQVSELILFSVSIKLLQKHMLYGDVGHPSNYEDYVQKLIPIEL